ncbi:MAG: sulfite exporter TauE/SafE family protein [bacterium]|nr:sulfite exporter TauE/SafE family protein [bacterium]
MEIALIALLTLVASVVGTLSGFGTSSIMVPTLLFFFPLSQVLLFAGIIHWAVDVWKVSLFRQGVRWRLILLFGVPGVALAFLGARLVFSFPEALLSQVLGGFLVSYVVFLFLNPSFKIPQNDAAAVTGGALSGFSAGIFGVGGAIRGAFLTAFSLPKIVYIATAGAIGFAVDATRVTAYVLGGATLPPHLLWGLLLFIPVSFLGATIAKKIVGRIPEGRFRGVVALFLLLVGARLLLFS